jgi:ABC-type cobalamin/Fe3+-siderophores transport system ATPase subunit
MVVLHRGSIYDAGTPHRALTPTLLRDMYDVHADVVRGAGGVPQVQAIASLRTGEAIAAGRPS